MSWILWYTGHLCAAAVSVSALRRAPLAESACLKAGGIANSGATMPIMAQGSGRDNVAMALARGDCAGGITVDIAFRDSTSPLNDPSGALPALHCAA